MTLRIAIVGAGLMGAGLATVFARGGHHVLITDPMPQTLATVRERIGRIVVSLGDTEEISGRVTPVAGLADAVADVDLVLEAAPEKLDLKQRLFVDIEAAARPDAILASNTSVIPISKIMAGVKRKGRALGTHWWNPPYLVPLVEVIQTADTELRIVNDVMALLISLGKVPVHVKKDVPGFVGNRLQHALWREAISLVENGVCDAETVDLVVKNSFGARLAVLGPLENADLVGTDLTLDIHNQVLGDLADAKTPSPYLKQLVADGKLGFKSYHGFKCWTDQQITDLRAKIVSHLKKSFN
ncbi:MAG: NAD(P)-binding domain-containing protein [Phyllobacteriaceae bacterium]|nr:NAD(P)-binding domain-containing protein [Phyllobacteriaceae bacterium]